MLEKGSTEYIVGAIAAIGVVVFIYMKFIYQPTCNQNEIYNITQKSCICLPNYSSRLVNGIVDGKTTQINKCMKDLTYNNKIFGYYDDNNKKVCNNGRTGDNCQCLSSSKPQTTMSESCSALQIQCVNDGKTENKWEPLPYATSCDTVYDVVKGEVKSEVKGETKEDRWRNSCTPVISNTGMKDIITCNITSNKMASVTVTDICTTFPPEHMKLSDVEICNGYELICTGKDVTGRDKGWEKKLLKKTCEDLYGLINGKQSDTRENWNLKCGLLPGVGNQDINFINNLTCFANSDGMMSITSRTMCPINIPSKLSDDDICNGINWVCTDDGWKKKLTHTSCSTLFGQISNISTDDQKGWEKKCKTIIGDQYFINKYTCSLNSDNNANITIKPLCPITVPSTLVISEKEQCEGYAPLCTESDGWIKSLITNNCDSLYGIATNQLTDDIANWEKKCSTVMGDPLYMNSFECAKDSNMNTYMKATKLCPLTAPNTACPYGNVLYCDQSTGNDWKCMPQQPTKECIAPPPGQSLCKGNVTGSSLICVECGQDNDGNSLHEMTCQNNPPSFTCLSNLNKNIKPLTVEGFESFANVWTADTLPIYPTIDNDLCSTNQTSTSLLTTNNYDGWRVFENPDGFISSYENTRKFYSATTGLTYLSKESLPCFYTPKDIVSDLGGNGLNICSNLGVYTQDKDTNNKDVVTGLRSGYCSCTGYSYLNGLNQNVNKQYLGGNCQYNDIVNCSKNGSVDNKGKCTCLTGYGGTTCNLGRNQCNNKGTPSTESNDLQCICDVISDVNSVQYDPKTNCQQCNTYTYTVSEDIRIINNLASTTITKRALGPSCSIRDDKTCSGNGVANPDGTCKPYFYYSNYQQKNVSFVGSNNIYDDNLVCDSNGIVNNKGICTCRNAFDNTKKNDKNAVCVSCVNDPNNLKDRSDCLTCTKKDMDPDKACAPCKNGPGYDITNCEVCKKDVFGPKCEYDSKAWCQNGGVWKGMNGNVPKACVCPYGFSGLRCEHNAEKLCDPKPSQGQVFIDNGCRRYDSDKPWVCAEGCQTYFKTFKDINNNGTCNYEFEYKCATE